MYSRRILAVLGGLVGLLGLSVVSRKAFQAVRKLRSPPLILIVGPPGAGKTTLFQYLRHPSRLDGPHRIFMRRRSGRIAANYLDSRRAWFRATIIDDSLGGQPNHWAERLRSYNPEGLIFLVDTHNPDEDHTYFRDLYNSYQDFSRHAKQVNLRVLLILLNKFDQWGSTTGEREAMLDRYRNEVWQELVHRFRNALGITLQYGYASLTHREHIPYNDLVVKEFLAALEPQR